MALRIDIEPGTEHLLPFAKKKLADLKLGDLLNQNIHVNSGERIFIQRGEVDLIRIRGAIIEVAFRVDPLGGSGYALSSFSTVGAPLNVFGVSATNALVPVTAADYDNLIIDAVARCLKAREFTHAEHLLRTLAAPGAFGVSNDVAIAGDDDIRVDTAALAAKPYFDRLNTVVEKYAGAIAHVLTSEEGTFLLALGPPLLGELGPTLGTTHTYTYGSTVLADVTRTGTPPGFEFREIRWPADYGIPEGSRINYHKQIVTDVSMSLATVNAHRRRDRLLSYQTEDQYRFYTVVTPAGGQFRATYVSAPVDALLGPGSGTITLPTWRYTAVRELDGQWSSTAIDQTGEALFPFTQGLSWSSVGGYTEFFAVPPVDVSGDLVSYQETGGGQTAYGTTPYNSADITLELVLWDEVGTLITIPSSPSNAAPTALTDPVRIRFALPNNAARFELTQRNRLRIITIDDDGGESVAYDRVPTAGLRALSVGEDAPLSRITRSYEYPETPKTGGGTIAELEAFAAAFSQTAQRTTYYPRSALQNANAPLGYGTDGVAVLYRPRDGKFLVARLLSPTAFGRAAYIGARTAYINQLLAGTDAAAAYAAVRALVSIEYLGGLPEELFFLAPVDSVGQPTAVLI